MLCHQLKQSFSSLHKVIDQLIVSGKNFTISFCHIEQTHASAAAAKTLICHEKQKNSYFY